MTTEVSPIQATAVSLSGDGFRAFQAAGFAPPWPSASAATSLGKAATAPGDAATLEEAVRHLAGYAAQSKAELQFRIDPDAGRLVVTITDRATGDVLMQMPSEEALRLAKLITSHDAGLTSHDSGLITCTA